MPANVTACVFLSTSQHCPPYTQCNDYLPDGMPPPLMASEYKEFAAAAEASLNSAPFSVTGFVRLLAEFNITSREHIRGCLVAISQTLLQVCGWECCRHVM